jgi:small-conductance mechanosensitive channel
LTRQQIASWTVPVLVFCIAALLALIARHLLLHVLSRRASRFEFPAVLLEAIRLPSVLWCVAAALAIAIHNAHPPRVFEYWAHKSIGAFVIISITLVIASIAVRMVAVYGERNRIPFAVAGLSRTLIYIFVFSVGLLMLLSQFEVRITPILTALGVGGLAVALALQDTLANLFAGIHILVEEPISVGDFIELTEGQKGTVLDIGWRTTRIRTFGNNILVIPNQKITSGILTNYRLNDARVVAEITIVAAHHAEPDRIAAIAMEAAAGVPGTLDDPPPVVLFDPGVLPTHLQMKLLVHVANVLERSRVQSQIRVRIYGAFVRNGIPFPELRAG